MGERKLFRGSGRRFGAGTVVMIFILAAGQFLRICDLGGECLLLAEGTSIRRSQLSLIISYSHWFQIFIRLFISLSF